MVQLVSQQRVLDILTDGLSTQVAAEIMWES